MFKRGREVELRDPRGATKVYNVGMGNGQPQIPKWNSERAFEFGYYSNVFVMACLRALSQDVASMTFSTGLNSSKPSSTRDNSRLAQLLGTPDGQSNPEFSARRLWAWSTLNYLVAGRFAWENELQGRTPVALWPLMTSKFAAIASNGGNSYWQGFEYTTEAGKKPIPYNLDEVTYIWNPSPDDPREPESALRTAKLDISILVMQDTYDYAFLRNNATPATMVTHQRFAEKEQRKAFRRQFSHEHQGPANAGKPIFVEFDGDSAKDVIDIRALGLSQKDQQAVQRYQEKLKSICVALGVPMSKLDASGRSWDNAEVEDRTYWGERVKPLSMEIASEVNLRLAPKLGNEKGWFRYDLVPQLKKSRFTVVDGLAMVTAKLITPQEFRDEVGLGEMPPELEEMLAAKEEASKAATESLALAGAGAGAPTPPGDAPVEEKDTEGPPTTRSLDPVAVEERRSALWRAADRQMVTVENMWERSMRALFVRQQATAISRLMGKRGRAALRSANPDPSEVFDRVFWTRETQDVAIGLYEGTMSLGALSVVSRFDIDFDLANPRAQEWLLARANQLSGQVTGTTYAAIQKAMLDGVVAGEGIDNIADRIRSVFTSASENRATLIARTEVLAAYNTAAQYAAYSLPAGTLGGKEWIATRDARTRDSHSAADGQIIRLDEVFTVGGHRMETPGQGPASEVCNCRCTVAFLTPDEVEQLGGFGSSRSVPRSRAATLLRLVAADHVTPNALEEIA